LGKLVVCFKKIELDNLSKLKSLRKAFYDGAPIATFKITFKDETYKSPSFDHGFLQNIEQFVNKINSFVKQKDEN
jgi:hypothetical protein